jgi:hypothetical protein
MLCINSSNSFSRFCSQPNKINYRDLSTLHWKKGKKKWKTKPQKTSKSCYHCGTWNHFFYLLLNQHLERKPSRVTLLKSAWRKHGHYYIIIEQVQHTLNSQRYDIVLPYIYVTRGDNLKGITWNLGLLFQ